MASDAHRTADEFLQAQQHYYTNLKAKKDEMQRYRASRQQHEDAAKLLADLPTKTRHEVMVPMGSKAFMPGELIHTNEVMVLLGENYFAERSSFQAGAIVRRRMDVIDEVISKLEKQIKDLGMRGDLSAEARKSLMAKIESEGARGAPAPAPAEGHAKGKKQGVSWGADKLKVYERDGEEEEEEGDEEQDEGKGVDFWRNAGFTGCFAAGSDSDDAEGADEPARPDAPEGAAAAPLLLPGTPSHQGVPEDEDEDEEKEEEAAEEEEEFRDDEPVMEIIEPVEGGEGRIITHESQTAFASTEAVRM